MKTTKKIKSVRFSPYSELVITNYPSKEDINKKWHSSQEKVHLKREFAYDVSNCSKMLAMHETLHEPLTEDEMIMCLGLESVISRDIAKHVLISRKLHVQRILDEQNRQRRSRSKDDARLASISCKSSEESRVRSHKIGVRSLALKN